MSIVTYVPGTIIKSDPLPYAQLGYWISLSLLVERASAPTSSRKEGQGQERRENLTLSYVTEFTTFIARKEDQGQVTFPSMLTPSLVSQFPTFKGRLKPFSRL